MSDRIPTRVFISAVSSELRSYRLKLANQLGALKGRPFEIKVQEDFRQGGHTLLDALADYIRACDLVVHVVGDACGARPTPEHERTLFEHVGQGPPNPRPCRSYTQWEYRLARMFDKRVLVYLAAPEAPRDGGWPIRQSQEDARLQQGHLASIQLSGEHRKAFTSHHHFVREVFHDLGLEPSLKVNNLPYKSLGSLFKGRDAFLDKIHTTLGRAEHRGHQRFAAITASASAATVYGLGGIGKTRAAVEFALRHAEDYTALLFVGASSPADLKQNLAALCGPLVLDLAEKEAKEVDVQVAAVLRWLGQSPGWFLIFDNVDTEAAAQAVEDLLGRLQSAGQVLVTSRLSGWPGAVETLMLDVLGEDDAAAFLLERTADRRRPLPDDRAQSHKLALELGQLALALEQAGAYIGTHRLTFREYLAAWQSSRDKVLAWFDERLMQYPKSVAVTWQTSFDQLDKPARQLLNRLSWLAAEPIPDALLDVPVPEVAEEGEPRGALTQLEAYSLVTRAAATPTFSVHRLVADVTRRRLTDDEGGTALAQALGWVDAAFIGDPTDVRRWPVLDPLAPHARAVVEHGDRAGVVEPTSTLISQVGLLLDRKALFAEAEPLLRRALAINQTSYGPEHYAVALSLNDLGRLHYAQGRYNEARPLHERSLAISEKALGPEHPDVATSLNNLAQLHRVQGRYDEARPLYERSLAISEKALGPEHPDVATSLNDLAGLHRVQGRYDEARPLYERSLAIFEKALGPEHPDVATSLNNLALLHDDQGRYDEARPLYERSLAIREKALGPEHPDVATSLNNLALLHRVQGRYDEARPLYERSLAIREKALGPEHPDVAQSLNNLAGLLKATSRLTEAEPLMRRALAIFQSSLGSDHPSTQTVRSNLAVLDTALTYEGFKPTPTKRNRPKVHGRHR